MACVHLRQLIQLCEDHQLKVGGADMIHFVCEQCGVQEECPHMLMDEYDRRREGEKVPNDKSGESPKYPNTQTPK
jgi:hypothetical protein